MKQNKKRSAVIASAVAILLLVTGTFAWTAFTQQGLNEKDGYNSAGGRVHDDYNKLSGNKDIYAENYSSQKLIARIKLSEYLENNGTSLVKNATKDDKKTWTPYTLDNKNVFRKYVNWELGGEKVFLPTFNKDNKDLSTDATGDAIDANKQAQTARGNGNQDDFVLGNKYALDPENDNKDTIPDPDFPDDPEKATKVEKNTAQNTLTQDQAPITMAAWKALPAEQQKGNYWVVDTDGWAYWANILAPGQTTSLLLDQLDWSNKGVGYLEDYYYGIDVVGEFVSPIDKDKFPNSEYGAPSDDANDLIANLRNIKLGNKLEFTTDVSNVQMDAREVKQFGAKVTNTTLSGTTDTKATDIKWSISPASAGMVDDTGKVTLGDVTGGTKVTVTAASESTKTSNSFDIETTSYALKFTEDVSNISMDSRGSKQFAVKNTTKTDKDGTADVETTNLKWSISPVSAGTIDDDGKLTLGYLASDTNITVTATENISDDKKVSNSFTIKGKVFSTAIGATFDFHGEDYIYLKDLGDGNRLVWRKYLLNDDVTNTLTYNGGPLDLAMKNYYAGLSDEAKAEVQPVQQNINVGDPLDLDGTGFDPSNPFIPTSPRSDRTVVTTDGEKKAFALSVYEITDLSGSGKLFSTANPRSASKESNPSVTKSYWTRSPKDSQQVYTISGFTSSTNDRAGFFNNYKINTSLGARPAMIIQR